MEKIRLGKTEMMVTRLGLGGIPIQRLSEEDAVAVVRRCLDLGMNFIDTANAYTNSEERIGKAIAGRRESVFLATKSGARTARELESHLELSLSRLGVGYIDLYQFHGVSDFSRLEHILGQGSLLDVLEAAKKAGKIRHIGITSHQLEVAKAAVKSGRFETIMFPLNFIASESADELLPLAREHDLGYIVMKPFAGGMLENATFVFKYLFQFPDVLMIPGIQKIPEIEEIVDLLKGPQQMTSQERTEIERMKEELGTRFCRNCDYCQPCKQEIHISMVLAFPNLAKTQPPERLISGSFAEMMEKAADCLECGECEPKCPYHLPIMEMMDESRKLFESIKRQYQK